MLPCLLTLFCGCRNAISHNGNIAPRRSTVTVIEERATPQANTAWTPHTQGIAYQLSLKHGVFGFCDKEAGSQRLDLATGRQYPGSEHCDWNHEEVQSNCDDYVLVSGPQGGGNDDVMVGDNDYRLHGHMHACDQQGKMVIVTSFGGVELIDGPSKNVAIVDPKGGERAVIGSDWIAWQTYDRKKSQLQLETVVKAMENAKIAK